MPTAIELISFYKERKEEKKQFQFARMKSSLKKLWGLAFHNHKHASSKSIQPLGQLDKLTQATQTFIFYFYSCRKTSSHAWQNPVQTTQTHWSSCHFLIRSLYFFLSFFLCFSSLFPIPFQCSHIFQTITIPSDQTLSWMNFKLSRWLP